jgi:hypothetical protein
MKRRKMGISKKRVERSFKRQLGRKVKKIEKSKKNLFRRLFHRKKKLPVGRKQELDRKISREKKDLVRQKIGVRKKFARRLGEEKKVVQKKVESERGREKKEKIRRLLARGRRQLSNGNKFGAKNTYRKLRLIHATLKSGEKSRSLYEDILRFHRRLT